MDSMWSHYSDRFLLEVLYNTPSRLHISLLQGIKVTVLTQDIAIIFCINEVFTVRHYRNTAQVARALKAKRCVILARWYFLPASRNLIFTLSQASQIRWDKKHICLKTRHLGGSSQGRIAARNHVAKVKTSLLPARCVKLNSLGNCTDRTLCMMFTPSMDFRKETVVN